MELKSFPLVEKIQKIQLSLKNSEVISPNNMPNPILEKYGISEVTTTNPILNKYKIPSSKSSFFDRYLTQSALSQVIGSKVIGEVFAGGARVPRTVTGVAKGLANNFLESKWDPSKVIGKDMRLDPPSVAQARTNILKSFQVPGGMFAPAGSEKAN